MASSSALVCNDWVCPWVAAIASMQVRATLLNGSCAVNDQPDVANILSNYVEGSDADRSAVAGLVAKGAFGGVHFRSTDLDATFARLVEHGAEVVDEPADQPWGVRDGSVRDPSGNLIRIDQA